MVSEHQDDGRLLLLAEVVHQQPEGLVSLVGEGQVLLGHRVLARLVGELHLGRVILHRVAAVVLDGDVKEEQPLLRVLVLKLIDDLTKGRLVADIAVLLGDRHVHVLHTLKLVEAEQRVGLVALPGSALAGVEGQGTVAVFPEQRGQRSRRLQNVLLIGDAARRQKGHRVAGQKLKLTGAGARAEHRGVGMAKDEVVQRVDVVGDALAQRKVSEILKVRPGLVHDSDDVGAGVGRNGRLLFGDAGGDALDVFSRGILRLLHRHELGVAQKDRQRPVLRVGAGLVPDIGLDAEGFQRGGMQHRVSAGRDGAQVTRPEAQPVFGGAKPPTQQLLAQQKDHPRQQQEADHHLQIEREAVAVRHRRRCPQGGEVPRQDGGTAKQRNVVVGDPPHKAQDVGNHTAQNDVVGQGAQGEVHHPDAQVVGKQNTERIIPGQVAAVGKLHQIKGGDGGEQHQQGKKRLLPRKMPAHKFFYTIHDRMDSFLTKKMKAVGLPLSKRERRSIFVKKSKVCKNHVKAIIEQLSGNVKGKWMGTDFILVERKVSFQGLGLVS